MKRTLLLLATLALLLLILFSSTHVFIYAQKGNAVAPLAISGIWRTHPYDLLYTVALSSEQQPNGPLIVYRALGADLRNVVPVLALQRNPLNVTPLLYPSPDGHYLTLSTPQASHISTATLSLFSSDGKLQNLPLAHGVATNDTPVWSADSQALYYHSVIEQRLAIPGIATQHVKGSTAFHSDGTAIPEIGYDEIHRVDVFGHDSVLWRHESDGSSLRLVGIDASGELIATQARPQQPVTLMRIVTDGIKRQPLSVAFGQTPTQLTTLPSDILPGNVLRLVNNGSVIECERVLSWQPLSYILIDIDLATGAIARSQPLFKTPRDVAITPLSVAPDGAVQVMSQVTLTQHDLAVQGIPDVPAQEQVIVRDVGAGTSLGASQRLTLLPGAQVVQAFWTAGGEDSVGLPADMGNGAAMHGWSAGWVQTFMSGSYQAGAILLANGSTTAYWVFGAVWSRYLADGGAAGCHGFPTSALTLYSNSSLGADNYLRQTFQHGDIVWDATTRTIAQDSCA